MSKAMGQITDISHAPGTVVTKADGSASDAPFRPRLMDYYNPQTGDIEIPDDVQLSFGSLGSTTDAFALAASYVKAREREIMETGNVDQVGGLKDLFAADEASRAEFLKQAQCVAERDGVRIMGFDLMGRCVTEVVPYGGSSRQALMKVDGVALNSVAHPGSIPPGVAEDVMVYGIGGYATKPDGTRWRIKPEEMFSGASLAEGLNDPEPDDARKKVHSWFTDDHAFSPGSVETVEMETRELRPLPEHTDADLAHFMQLPDGKIIGVLWLNYNGVGSWMGNKWGGTPAEAYEQGCRYLGPAEYRPPSAADVSEPPGNHDYHGPLGPDRVPVPDPAHERFHRAVGNVLAGKIMPKAREQMQDALGRTPPDAPTTASTSKPMPDGAVRFVVPEKGVRW